MMTRTKSALISAILAGGCVVAVPTAQADDRMARMGQDVEMMGDMARMADDSMEMLGRFDRSVSDRETRRDMLRMMQETSRSMVRNSGALMRLFERRMMEGDMMPDGMYRACMRGDDAMFDRMSRESGVRNADDDRMMCGGMRAARRMNERTTRFAGEMVLRAARMRHEMMGEMMGGGS